ncbi:zinc ribbon domain-containing protein [Phycicoccus sonneratiae]|uniref:Zinc-ribbon domain-containing protein n=1 Tax=Phycicoccus sonneratiae TaxID=2807628 RepID=A0ABS2CND2_9MICO|nr:zinc ribbon domain-containing protein [Phycicoccus sonneraticus]MBM6401387.1 zinc-ribbon domain-containing protein [Phycicoccus sonneraticus]
MTCPECGATQADEARFCSRCGTALLARRDEEPLSPAGDDDPMPALDDTSDLDELLPFSQYPDVHRPGGGYPDRDDEHLAPAGGTGPGDPDSRRGCLGMVALAMVGLLMLAGLLWYFGSGDEPESPTAASPTASSTTAPSGQASLTDQPSASPTGPQPTQRASTAKKCGELEGGMTAWSGNEVTTCDFAIETARALQAAGGTLPATVTATSPVTKKDYEMTCANTTPVVCRGGTDALVYIDVAK